VILGRPRACVNLCGTTVEWGIDRQRRVGLIETTSREAHVCPRRLLGCSITCACGRRVHTYAHGYVEDAATGLPHQCTPVQTTGARAAPSREGTSVGAPSRPPTGATPPAPEPPRRSLNDALGVG
jgi:hypothetical protein